MDINNKEGKYREGSMSRNQERDSGLRAVGDDEDSCFDLDFDAVPNSEVSDLQISCSLLPVHELCDESQAIPMKSMEAHDAESSLGQKCNNHESNADVSEPSKIRRSLSCQELRTSVRLIEPRPSLDAGTAYYHQIYFYNHDWNESRDKLGGQEPLGARKSFKATAVLSSSFIKFVIKLPSQKIRSTLVSAVRSYRHLAYKWVPQKKSKITGGSKNTSRSFGSRGMDFRSCPGSVASSPCHRIVRGDMRVMERDCSVSAAIAHCKLTFNGGKRLSA